MSLNPDTDPWPLIGLNLSNANVSKLPTEQHLKRLSLIPLLRFGDRLRESIACKQVISQTWRFGSEDVKAQNELYRKLKDYADEVYSPARDAHLDGLRIRELLTLYAEVDRTEHLGSSVVSQLADYIGRRRLAMEAQMRHLDGERLTETIQEARDWLAFAKHGHYDVLYSPSSNFIARLQSKLEIWLSITQ